MQWAHGLLHEVALAVWLAGPYAQLAGWIELLAGAPDDAVAVLRPACLRLQEIGEMSWFSTTAGLLAEALYDAGRPDEAGEQADHAREAAAPHDVYSQVLWRTVAAKVAAGRGQADEAARLCQEAIELVTPTDFLHLQWHTWLTHARALSESGRTAEAIQAAARAAELAAAKQATHAERLATQLQHTLEV
jgi:ATP/maltotriose-dependent transcriptional regulator MalT